MVTKMKPNINSVEIHLQLSNNGHPVDGALVGAGALLPYKPYQHYTGGARRLKPKELGTDDCCTRTYLLDIALHSCTHYTQQFAHILSITPLL
jgi:hypothetical protein